MVQRKLGAYPPKLMTEVPNCQLDMHLAKDVPDDRAIPLEATKLTPGSPEAKVAMLHNMLGLCDGDICLRTRYETSDGPLWAKEKRMWLLQWKLAPIPWTKVATSWSYTPTQKKRLKTIGGWAPVRTHLKKAIALLGNLCLPVAVSGLLGEGSPGVDIAYYICLGSTAISSL